MVMQEVLIKFIHSPQHFVDTPNHKVDEILLILDESFNHLKGQAQTTKAYYFLSKQINMRYQRVFERLAKLKSDAFLVSEAMWSHARGEYKNIV